MANQEAQAKPKSNVGFWLGILAIVLIMFFYSLTIPNSSQGLRDRVLKGNLHHIRNVIEQFKEDTGAYPSSLPDLIRAREDAPTAGVNAQGDAVPIAAGAYQGPYISFTGGIGNTGIPNNPYKKPDAADYHNIDAHWTYRNGILRPATEGETLDGIPYTQL